MVRKKEGRCGREAGSVVERKVKLPIRWLKGFVEVQAYAPRLDLLCERESWYQQRGQ